MARPKLLPEGFYKHDFLLMMKHERHGRNRMRLLAMHHIQQGKTYAAVSEIVASHRLTVQSWLRRFRGEGAKMQSISGLEKLKDIHLPQAVSIWPLAPGYYLLGIISLALIIGLIVLGIRKKRQARLPKAIKKAFSDIKNAYQQDGDLHQAARALSVLLKRVCLAKFNRHDVAALTDHAWLLFLDKTGHTKDFTQGDGALLVEGAYNPNIKASEQQLFSVCQKWLYSSHLKSQF